MAKMTVIYKTPKNQEAFEKHYFEVHVPLSKQLPGLVKYEINDGQIISTTGHRDVYRVANLYFESLGSMMDAFQSDIGKQCAADRKILAGDDDVQIYVYDTKTL